MNVVTILDQRDANRRARARGHRYVRPTFTLVGRSLTSRRGDVGMLLTRPTEPTGSPAVVAFRRRFSDDGPTYNYAAIRADDGYWYLSGRTSTPRAYDWDALLTWIDDLAYAQLRVASRWNDVGD